ncbi:MAG: serine/threonine protein kinase [Planctomycetota bacterium]|jgi:serine/threonine protein kinase
MARETSSDAQAGSGSDDEAVLRPTRRSTGKPNIEGYELEEVLGRGAMGTVYRARQLSVDREVALKILHPELVARPRIVMRMQREARMTARLAHPNLVSAVDMGTLDGRLWYAMELVDGPTLSLRLRQEGRLSEREALRLFIPLCEALGHLSEHGIVHRDVKPANILLDKRGVARLADLGLAFADEDPKITRHGGTLGTPQYISPEQAVDPTTADARSDLWSFGATLFHAVCGRPPFAGESTAEVLSAVLYERVPDPRELEPTLSKGFALVLRKCLAGDPSARYQTPGELLLDLERVRERRQPRVRRSALDPTASQRDRRPLYLALGAIGLIAAGLLVGSYGPWRDRRERELQDQVAEEVTSPLLDAIERGLASGTGLPGVLMGDHASLEVDLPDSLRERWANLGKALDLDLLDRIAELRAELEVDLESELANGDYLSAWDLTQVGVATLVLERTGIEHDTLVQSFQGGLSWSVEMGQRVDQAEEEALGRLQTALDDHAAALDREVTVELEQQHWATALGLLIFDRAAIMESTGFSDHRFRPERVEAVLVGLKTLTKINRDDISDDWRGLDRELRGLVVKRADRLHRELEAEGAAFSAALQLATYFNQELSRRNLTEEDMPSSLPRTARAALDRELESLHALEDSRLEKNLRSAVRETDRAAQEAWQVRDVARIQELWLDVRTRLGSPGGLIGANWRTELELEVAGRLLEAELVGELLKRVADQVIARDNQRIDLRLRGVLYSERYLIAGPDPLRFGFQVSGLDEVLRLQDLKAHELVRVAQLEDPEQLSTQECVALAVLLQRDGEQRESLTLLRAERETGSPALERLALELAVRATDALEAARDGVASSGSENTGADANSEASPLGQAEGSGTTPSVRDVLRPSSVDELRGGRRRLNFDFSQADPGEWSTTDWHFDGLSWTHTKPVVTVADFARTPGLSLPLESIPGDSEKLVVHFDLELPQEAGRARLLVFELDGVYIALVGERFPGVPSETRLLVETAGLHALLERAQKPSEGKSIQRPLRPGQRCTLEIELGGRRRRVDVRVNGETLKSWRQVRTPAPGPKRLSLRAWEPIRLWGVGLEY